MPDRKFVACKFRSTDARSFTYHYDGDEPLQIGDMVKVPDRSGDGWKRVEVVSIGDEQPPFPTKGILGLYDPDLEAGAADDALFSPAPKAAVGNPLDDDKILC